jgi:hypothetical protein
LSRDLALPLTQIKSSIELLDADNFGENTAREVSANVSLSAEAGIQLLEAYHLLLSADNILNEDLVAVSIGSVLEEIAHSVSPYAKRYATDLVVDIQGRFAPVLAHPASLSSALEVLATSLIRAQAAQSQKDKYRLVLGAHRLPEGAVAAGAFCSVRGLSDRSLRAARSLVGQARQPLPAIPPGAASGILIADMLCGALWQPLHTSAHHGLFGLATELPITNQLQFV